MRSRWALESDYDDLISNPNWQQISKALSKMDGSSCSFVSLTLESKGALLAGGGNEQRYIVTYIPITGGEYDNSLTLTLADLSLQGPEMYPPIEGVTSGPFPAKWCVHSHLLFEAFRHFFETGRLVEDLTWEE